jgi:hypothetical protein
VSRLHFEDFKPRVFFDGQAGDVCAPIGRSSPTASFPWRHEDEVRETMKELGLVAQTGKRGNVRVVR